MLTYSGAIDNFYIGSNAMRSSERTRSEADALQHAAGSCSVDSIRWLCLTLTILVPLRCMLILTKLGHLMKSEKSIIVFMVRLINY